MDLFLIVLILLISIGISNLLSRFLPFIPVALFQIFIGIIIALLFPFLQIQIEPELFLILFIAPILFNEAKMISRRSLYKMFIPIMLQSIGLVFFTIFIVGYCIYYLIPFINLPISFALAAILSPTDIVAVNSLSKRVSIPKSIYELLTGESLMNDASGLVAFKFAIAAVVTGTFSFFSAAIEFLKISLGGILVGIVIIFLIIEIRKILKNSGLEDVTFHVLILVLTPFIIYLISEFIGVSGILAVVSGGILYALEKDYSELIQVKLQVVSNNVWTIFLYIINGLVFLILGLQIPHIIKVIINDYRINTFESFLYSFLIFIFLIIIRFIWNYILINEELLLKKGDIPNEGKLKVSFFLTFSGVRGAVTLVGAFSIPLFLSSGVPFPNRSLIIFISALVILYNLIFSTIFLPFFYKKITIKEQKEIYEKSKAKVVMEIINRLKEEANLGNQNKILIVINEYMQILKDINKKKIHNLSLREQRKLEKLIYKIGIDAERKEIEKLLKNNKIDKTTFEIFERKLNRSEIALGKYFGKYLSILFLGILKFFKIIYEKRNKKNNIIYDIDQIKKIRDLKIKTSTSAIEEIKKHINDKNKSVSLYIINEYIQIIEIMMMPFKLEKRNKNFELKVSEYRKKGMLYSREIIQEFYESGIINRETSNDLKQFFNYWEASHIEDNKI